jgi:hypothetical protein
VGRDPLLLLFGEIALVALLFRLLPFWQPWNVVARSQSLETPVRRYRWSVRGRSKAWARLHEVVTALSTGTALPRGDVPARR